MTKLDPASGHLVLINTFKVAHARAEELLALLVDATEQGMRQRPGFISANLHVAEVGEHVANYAQWRSRADFDAMLADPTAQAHMKKAAEIAESFQPILYRLHDSVSVGD